MCTLVFVSFGKLYQIFETMIVQLSKHLEFRQKYSAAHSIFQLSFRYLDIPMKHCLSCLIYYFSKASRTSLRLQAKATAEGRKIKWLAKGTDKTRKKKRIQQAKGAEPRPARFTPRILFSGSSEACLSLDCKLIFDGYCNVKLYNI